MNKKIKKYLINEFFKTVQIGLKEDKKIFKKKRTFKNVFGVLPRRKNFIFEYFEEIYGGQIDFGIKIYKKKNKQFLFTFVLFFSYNNENNEIFFLGDTIYDKKRFLNKKLGDTIFFKQVSI